MLVGFLLCTCGLFQWTRPPWYPHVYNKFSSDNEHLQDQEFFKCLILKLKALWFFEMLVTVNSQHSKYSRRLTVFPVLVTPEYFTCSDTAFQMHWEKRLINELHLKGVTVGFQIMNCCVTSIWSTWHWLYNNHSLSVLYKLNGSTHLPCCVKPYPLTRAVTFTYVLLRSVGSCTGWMVSETINTCVLMQNLGMEFCYISLISQHHHHHHHLFSFHRCV
jgi:hypothetical protein